MANSAYILDTDSFTLTASVYTLGDDTERIATKSFVLVPYPFKGISVSVVPSSGQLWPRGNP